MAVYFFETITAAQAATYNAATDTIVFTDAGASASNTGVSYATSSITITEGTTGHAVTFGTGMMGETDFVFPDNSHLVIDGTPHSAPPPTNPPPPPPPTIQPFSVDGHISGNMETAHLSSLLGAAITATPSQLTLTNGLTQLALAGVGLTYDANEQLTGGLVTSINWTLNGGADLRVSVSIPLGVSAAPFGGWVLNDQTQLAFQTILAGHDRILGGEGNDVLHGFGGDDYMVGFGGSDQLYGGDGNDLIYAYDGPEFLLGAPPGPSYLRGEAGDDTLVGSIVFDDINGNQGNDSIDGGSGGADWLVGGQGADLIVAHASGNILYGNLGNDTLQGGADGEIVRGGQGDDSITGGGGNDFISGDRGNDTETGGSGADSFHTFSGAGIDRVLDFNLAEGDRVQVDPGTTWTLTQVGADTVIDMGNGDQMILVGVQLSTLTGAWIFGA